MMQTIFVVPMSSTPNGPDGAAARARWFVLVRRAAARGATYRSCRLSAVGAAGTSFGSAAGARQRAEHEAGPAGAGRSPAAAGRAARACACNSASFASACASAPSGSSTSVPLLRLQVPAPLADAHRGDDARLRCPAAARARRSGRRRRRARRRRPRSGSWPAKVGDVAVGDHLPVAVDQRGTCPRSARPRTAAARPACTTIVSGRRRSTVADCTQLMRFDARARRGEPRSRGSDRPGVHAERGAQQRFRRLRAALDDHSRDAQAEARGGVRRAGRCSDSRAAAERVRQCQRPASQHAQRGDARCRRAQQPALPADQQLQPAGPVTAGAVRGARRLHARHAAFSTIQAQSCGKLMPTMRRLLRQQRGRRQAGLGVDFQQHQAARFARGVVVAEIGAASRRGSRARDAPPARHPSRAHRSSGCTRAGMMWREPPSAYFDLVVVEAVARRRSRSPRARASPITPTVSSRPGTYSSASAAVPKRQFARDARRGGCRRRA